MGRTLSGRCWMGSSVAKEIRGIVSSRRCPWAHLIKTGVSTEMTVSSASELTLVLCSAAVEAVGTFCHGPRRSLGLGMSNGSSKFLVSIALAEDCGAGCSYRKLSITCGPGTSAMHDWGRVRIARPHCISVAKWAALPNFGWHISSLCEWRLRIAHSFSMLSARIAPLHKSPH